jgi:CBS domain-containing protein
MEQAMHIGTIATRDVVFCQRDTSALEAAQLMRSNHVGDLVVVEERSGMRVPIGIVTDRDLAVEVMAKQVDPNSITAGDIMTPDPMVAVEREDLVETIQRMRWKGIRRMPVTDDRGELMGIATLDDLVEFLAQTLVDVSHIGRLQQIEEQSFRP